MIPPNYDYQMYLRELKEVSQKSILEMNSEEYEKLLRVIWLTIATGQILQILKDSGVMNE